MALSNKNSDAIASSPALATSGIGSKDEKMPTRKHDNAAMALTLTLAGTGTGTRRRHDGIGREQQLYGRNDNNINVLDGLELMVSRRIRGIREGRRKRDKGGCVPIRTGAAWRRRCAGAANREGQPGWVSGRNTGRVC